MPGIEFVDADTGDHFDDDVLDTGPRRPWPRWVWVVAGLLALAVAVGALVSSRSDDARKPAVSPSSSAPPSAETGPVEQIVALTSDGTSLFWVAGQRLHRAGPVGRASASVAISPTGGDFAELQLVPDPAERTIWVVSHGSADSNGGAGNVEGFSTTDLTRVSRASARSLIGGAAVLDGALYVLASGRLLRIKAGGTGFSAVVPVDPHARSLVTAGNSLLFVEGGNSSAVGRWTPRGGVQRPVVLTTTDSSLAVVGSTVYVVGMRGGRDVLETLPDAGEFNSQEIPTGLTELQVVATGRSSLILLGSDEQGLELACITVRPRSNIARPMVQALATATSANVAVLRATIFQAVGGGVRPVSFPPGGCPG
ncbi:hypothetical protein [uncultured Jatrophihabitans sp.]|uniref:hypothetical protein n=1 Tax=uncultured Jatrophihabitans sp. TaxID=1610747 RepID=UPI0035C99F77